jgi:hypothetical protein
MSGEARAMEPEDVTRLATLLGGIAFSGGRLGMWIRWLLIANGLGGVIGVALGGFGFAAATIVAVVVWGVTLPVATVMLAVFFYRGQQLTAVRG